MLGRDPRTTVVGLVLIIGSVLYLGMRAFQGALNLEDLKSLLTISAGVGFLVAADSPSPAAQRGRFLRPPPRNDPEGLMAEAQYLHEQARLRRNAAAQRQE